MDATWIGFDVDWNRPDKDIPELLFKVGDAFFATMFFLELLIRFLSYEHLMDFFYHYHRRHFQSWNIYDTIVITVMVVGIFLGEDSIRRVSLLRLVRFVRLSLLMRWMPELNLFLRSLLGAIRSVFTVFIWSITLMYVYALFYTEWMKRDYGSDCKYIGEKNDICLQDFFGSIGKSFWALLQMMLLDRPISELVRPIFEDQLYVAGAFLVVYILLSTCTIFNMLTGLVVDSVRTVDERDKEKNQAAELEDIMYVADKNNDFVHRFSFEDPFVYRDLVVNLGINEEIIDAVFDLAGTDEESKTSFRDLVMKAVKPPSPLDLLEVQNSIESLPNLLDMPMSSVAVLSEEVERYGEPEFIQKIRQMRFAQRKKNKQAVNKSLERWERTRDRMRGLEAVGSKLKTYFDYVRMDGRNIATRMDEYRDKQSSASKLKDPWHDRELYQALSRWQQVQSSPRQRRTPKQPLNSPSPSRFGLVKGLVRSAPTATASASAALQGVAPCLRKLVGQLHALRGEIGKAGHEHTGVTRVDESTSHLYAHIDRRSLDELIIEALDELESALAGSWTHSKYAVAPARSSLTIESLQAHEGDTSYEQAYRRRISHLYGKDEAPPSGDPTLPRMAGRGPSMDATSVPSVISSLPDDESLFGYADVDKVDRGVTEFKSKHFENMEDFHPVYQDSALVEYYNAGSDQWVTARIRIGVVKNTEDLHLNEDEQSGRGELADRSRKLVYGLQLGRLHQNVVKEDAPLEQLRLPLMPGEPVEVFSLRGGGCWMPAFTTLTPGETVVGYNIKLGQGGQTLRRIPAERVRRRFIAGTSIDVYRGEDLGWCPAVVHSSAGDGSRSRESMKRQALLNGSIGSPTELWTLVPVSGELGDEETDQPEIVPSYMVRVVALPASARTIVDSFEATDDTMYADSDQERRPLKSDIRQGTSRAIYESSGYQIYDSQREDSLVSAVSTEEIGPSRQRPESHRQERVSIGSESGGIWGDNEIDTLSLSASNSYTERLSSDISDLRRGTDLSSTRAIHTGSSERRSQDTSASEDRQVSHYDQTMEENPNYGMEDNPYGLHASVEARGMRRNSRPAEIMIFPTSLEQDGADLTNSTTPSTLQSPTPRRSSRSKASQRVQFPSHDETMGIEDDAPYPAEQEDMRSSVSTRVPHIVSTQGNTVIVSFPCGQVGINHSRRNPGTVSKVVHGGQAHVAGVEVGWKIKAINDMDCESFKDPTFQDAKRGFHGDLYQVTFDASQETEQSIDASEPSDTEGSEESMLDVSTDGMDVSITTSSKVSLRASIASEESGTSLSSSHRFSGVFPTPISRIWFEDPRSGRMPPLNCVRAFYMSDCVGQVDGISQATFLRNTYDVPNGFHLELPSLPSLPTQKFTFRNAETAFLAVKFWKHAKEFQDLNFTEAKELSQRLEDEEDPDFAGMGGAWKAMKTILKQKFRKGTLLAAYLMSTQDDLLLAHADRGSKEDFWSDRYDGNGHNYLGLLLMLRRDKLMKRNEDKTSWTKTMCTKTGFRRSHEINMEDEEQCRREIGMPHVSGAWAKAVRNANKALKAALKVAEKGIP